MDTEVRVLFETPITFDVVDQVVHCPMVHVDVHGSRTMLILDTGSTAHVLTIELANDAHLPAKPDEAGTDHAGAPVRSWSLGEAPISIEDLEFSLRSVVAIEGPAPFLGWRVGGFLSPQSLCPAAFAVLDLVENRLTAIEGDAQDIAIWARSRFPALELLSLQRLPGEGVFVDASVEPFSPVKTMVNTGTASTEFAMAAVPGLSGTPPESKGLGVSGAEVRGVEAIEQTLRVGEAAFSIPALFVREAMPQEHGFGQIGMDVLLGTVLAVSANEDEPVLWLVPKGMKPRHIERGSGPSRTMISISSFERDDLAYGIEVKNTSVTWRTMSCTLCFGCAFTLGVGRCSSPGCCRRPGSRRWSMRAASALILKYQSYPWAHQDLARRVQKQLGLPVDSPRALEDGTMERFVAGICGRW